MLDPFLLGAAVCLLTSVAIGAYRYWYLHLLKTTEFDMSAADLDTDELQHLGAGLSQGKFWSVRIATWSLVATLSVAGAGLRTSQLTPPGIRQQWPTFLSILFIRWLLSAVIGRSYANYTLPKNRGH
jgi:hypothetical protein